MGAGKRKALRGLWGSRGNECDVYGTSPHHVVGLQPSSGFSQRLSLKPRGHQGALQVIVTPIEPSRENRCEGFFCPGFALERTGIMEKSFLFSGLMRSPEI